MKREREDVEGHCVIPEKNDDEVESIDQNRLDHDSFQNGIDESLDHLLRHRLSFSVSCKEGKEDQIDHHLLQFLS